MIGGLIFVTNKIINLKIIVTAIAYVIICSCSNYNGLSVPIEKVKLKSIRYYPGSQELSGEIFNNSEFIVTRIVLIFELFEFRQDSKIKVLFNELSKEYNTGSFGEFLEAISASENKKSFLGELLEISKKGLLSEFQLGTVQEFQRMIRDFHENEKWLVLKREIDLQLNLKPGLSAALKEKINSNITKNNLLYDFKVITVYGRK